MRWPFWPLAASGVEVEAASAWRRGARPLAGRLEGLAVRPRGAGAFLDGGRATGRRERFTYPCREAFLTTMRNTPREVVGPLPRRFRRAVGALGNRPRGYADGSTRACRRRRRVA